MKFVLAAAGLPLIALSKLYLAETFPINFKTYYDCWVEPQSGLARFHYSAGNSYDSNFSSDYGLYAEKDNSSY